MTASDGAERCLACDVPFRDGDEVYRDVSGDLIHAACCGPERASFVGADGEPLKDGDPLPEPWKWRPMADPDDTRPSRGGWRIIRVDVIPHEESDNGK